MKENKVCHDEIYDDVVVGNGHYTKPCRAEVPGKISFTHKSKCDWF